MDFISFAFFLQVCQRYWSRSIKGAGHAFRHGEAHDPLPTIQGSICHCSSTIYCRYQHVHTRNLPSLAYEPRHSSFPRVVLDLIWPDIPPKMSCIAPPTQWQHAPHR